MLSSQLNDKFTCYKKQNNIKNISNIYKKNKQQIFPRVAISGLDDNKVWFFDKKDLVMRHGRIVKANEYDKQIFKRLPSYRFWGFEDEKMFYPADIKSIEFDGASKNRQFKITITNKTYSSLDGVLMEYLNVKDKHRNRLCEGDILRNNGIFFLYYDANKSVFKTKAFDSETPTLIGLYPERTLYCEVIGNVYENYNVINNKHSLEIAKYYDFKNKQLTTENKKYLIEQNLADIIFKNDVFKPLDMLFVDRVEKKVVGA